MKHIIAIAFVGLIAGCTVSPNDPRIKAWVDTACAFHTLGVAPDGIQEALDKLKAFGVVFTCNGETLASTGAELVSQ